MTIINFWVKNEQPLRPYHLDKTGSRLITEVKSGWAKFVLGWMTAWEYFAL